MSGTWHTASTHGVDLMSFAARSDLFLAVQLANSMCLAAPVRVAAHGSCLPHTHCRF
jgi:hypothetical protein